MRRYSRIWIGCFIVLLVCGLGVLAAGCGSPGIESTETAREAEDDGTVSDLVPDSGAEGTIDDSEGSSGGIGKGSSGNDGTSGDEGSIGSSPVAPADSNKGSAGAGVDESTGPEDEATNGKNNGAGGGATTDTGNNTTTDSSGDASTPTKQTSTVTISIVGDEERGSILSATEFDIVKGDTVLDILKKATRLHKIQMEFRGRGALSYVKGIDNLYEFDDGPTSGWVYRINGILIGVGAGTQKVAAGDTIEWEYITERIAEDEANE